MTGRYRQATFYQIGQPNGQQRFNNKHKYLNSLLCSISLLSYNSILINHLDQQCYVDYQWAITLTLLRQCYGFFEYSIINLVYNL